MARNNGNEEGFYAKATLPSDLDDPAQYTEVGQITGWDLTSTSPSTEMRDKDGATVKRGTNVKSIRVGVNMDLTGNTGAGILNAAHEASPKTLIYWLNTSGVIGDRFFYGTAYVGERAEGSPADGAVTTGWTLDVVTFNEGEIAGP
jgi:hypothetical protein